MTDNKDEPKVVQTRRKVSTTNNENIVSEKPVTVEEEVVVKSNDTLDDSLHINAITEREAIREGEKAGIKPEVTKAVLSNRKIIIAFIALISALVIFSLGVVTGLQSASIIAEEVSDANTDISVVDDNNREDKILPPEGNQIDKGWTEGYKDGFYEGFYNGLNSSQNQYMDYGVTE